MSSLTTSSLPLPFAKTAPALRLNPTDISIRPTTLPTGFAAYTGPIQIGFLGIVKTGPEWRLVNFNIREPFRNHGIGTRLLQTVLHAARRSGIRLITLHAARPAQSLYRRFGFRPIETAGTKMYLKLPRQPPP